MTATVVATAAAVNQAAPCAADYSCRRWYHPEVATIGDRIEQARVLRGYGQRELARLAKQPETSLGVTIKRFREDPNHDVHINALRAYAAALGVNLLWLIDGTGPRDAGDGDSPRPILASLPGFASALVAAKKKEPFFPPYAWDDAAATSPLVTPPHVDAEMLIFAARLAVSLRTASEQETDEGRRIDAAESVREARQVEGEKRVREAAARGEKLSLAKAMAQLRREGGDADD